MTDFGHIGPYQLLGEVGRGAMARVWRAWDPNLQREVAIKEPLFDEQFDRETVSELGQRFVAEARVAGRLNHPGIVRIYAADVWDGRPALVMELVEGGTLAQLLTHGPLSPTCGRCGLRDDCRIQPLWRRRIVGHRYRALPCYPRTSPRTTAACRPRVVD